MLLDIDFMIKTLWKCVKAIPITLEITFFSIMLSIIPAYIISICRIKKRKIISQICSVYVSFLRGTPIILQILIVYSILPSLLNIFFKKYFPSVNIFDLNPIFYALIVFTLNTIATLSEVFRSAILTVDKGQYEAALCAGLSRFQSYIRIIIPQALVSALPNLCNLSVNLIKNTSLAFLMTVKDVTAVAKIEASFGFNYIESYLDIFLIYIIVCSIVQLIFKIVEKNFLKRKKNVKN